MMFYKLAQHKLGGPADNAQSASAYVRRRKMIAIVAIVKFGYT